MGAIKWFKDISSADVGTCGGKGSSLGELMRAGFPFADGFVLTIEAFGKNHNEWADAVYAAYDQLNTQYVAVRSSATKEDGVDDSFAGQFDTYLFVNRETLIEQIMECHKSIDSPRIIAYCDSKGINRSEIKVAVVIQKMVNSEVAGVAFTVNPVTNNRDEIMMEGGFGLGEAVVSGMITPDNYIWSKSKQSITDKSISHQTKKLALDMSKGGTIEESVESTIQEIQKLSDKHITALAKLSEKIEQHYGKPMDIEWALENDKLYILQARPITTLAAQSTSVDNADWILVENIPDSDIFFFQICFGSFVQSTSYPFVGNLEKVMAVYDGYHMDFYMGEADARTWAESILHNIVEKPGFALDVHENIIKHSALLKDYGKKLASLDLSTYTNEQLWDLYKEHHDIHTKLYTYGRYPVQVDILFGNFTEKLKNYLFEVCADKAEAERYFVILTTPTEKTIIAQEREELFAVYKNHSAEIQKYAGDPSMGISDALQQAIESFRKKWGHLGYIYAGNDGADLYSVKHYLDALVAIAMFNESVDEKLRKEQQQLDDAKSQQEAFYKEKNTPELYQNLFATARNFALSKLIRRDAQLYTLYQSHHTLLEQIAKKLGISRQQVQFMLAQEVQDALLKNILDPEISTKKLERCVYLVNKEGESVFVDEKALELKSQIKNKIYSTDEGIKGQVAQPGYAKGIVKIIIRAKDMPKMNHGDILVSIATDPDIVAAMQKAAAIITDQGGITAHAAIVSRELGIPCIIGTKCATQVLKDGDLVEVDAHNGIIHILDNQQNKAVPREKVLQRNFPVLGYTTGAYYEFHGINLGPVTWKRDREIMATYHVPQVFLIQDPRAYYTTNVGEIIQSINTDFEAATDKANQEIYDAVRIDPGSNFQDLATLSDLHKRSYGLMLLGFDLVIDIKSCIDKLIPDQSEDFLGFIETPIQKTAIQREQHAINAIKKNNAHADTIELEQLAYDFGYIHQDYCGEAWNAKKYRELLGQDNKLISHMDESYDISHLSDYEQWLIRMFKKMVYMYEEGRNAMVRCMRAINETSKKLHIDTDKLLYMTVYEVEEMCRQGDTKYMISDDLLALRKEGFVAHFDNGIYTEYTGKQEVEKFLSETSIIHFWDKKTVTVDELKGTVAFPGYAIGRARLVRDQKDANAVQDGEILISPMTQVEFLGGMRKCAAIVTDEGGIICHAAIVSREFGKPCILATKDATSAIKNGDLVEVDANMGVVRIVEKFQDNLLAKARKKNRAGRWSLLSCYYFGTHYTSSLQEKVGVGLEEAIMIVHKGYSACYFLEEHKKKFGTHFAQMAAKDNALVQEWSSKLMENTDIILGTIKNLMAKEFAKQDMDVFLEAFYNYSVYHRIIKVSVDYLAPDILTAALPYFEKARVYAEPVYENTEIYMRWVADALGKKYDIAPDLILATSPEQFADILDGKIPDISVLQTQCDSSVLYIQGGKAHYISGSSAQEFEQKLTAKNEAQQTISGQTAYPGKVQGKVRIVLDPKPDTVFERGEILVTGMTRPEYLPLVERSAAFVTDAGGILSHAAITARELQKPCVIGTEVASKILKDGDIVEVDADNGTVKILEKSDKKKDSSDAIIYDGKKWKPFVTRNMSFRHQRLGAQGYALHSRDFGIDEPNVVLSLCLGGTHTVLFSNGENVTLFGNAILKAIDSEQKIQELNEKYHTFAKELLASLATLQKSINPTHRKKFTDQYKRFAAGLQITATLGRVGSTRLMEQLQKIGYSEKQLPEIINTITYPDDHTPLFQSQYDLLNIAKDIQTQNIPQLQIQKKLQQWFDANCYIPINFCDDPWTIEDVQKQLEGLLIKDCTTEIAALDKQHEQQIKNKKQRLKKIDNKEITILAQAIAEGTILNEFRKNTFSKVSLGYRPVFERIALISGGKSWKDCFFLTADEMGKILEGKILNIQALIASRERVAFGVDEQGGIIFCDEEETDKIYDFVQNLQGKNSDDKSNLGQKEIRGYSASKGMAKGIARLVLSSRDFHKISAGDILVTTMTSVDFVPVMEKAGAFVTNEGGITSHASIVAREMNKPCIIGTQNATQIIKDGDIVEVDADNGIITIL